MLRQAVQSPRGRSRFQELLGVLPFLQSLRIQAKWPYTDETLEGLQRGR
jgi:hypothetical protein